MASLWRRKPVRILTILVVVVVVLVLVGRFLVPAEKVRRLVIDQIEQATGAEVGFGEASVAFWPRLKVVVAEGDIAGTGEALAAAPRPPHHLVSYRIGLDRLEIDLALGPLFKKRIETGKLRLIAPRIEAITLPPEPPVPGEDGGGQPAAAAGEAVPAIPWELAVAGVEIRDGSLRWQEEDTGRQVAVDGWQQEIQIGEISLLLARLAAFQAGGDPGDEVATSSDVNLQTRLARVSLAGFGGSAPVVVEDLELAGGLSVPSGADRLNLTVSEAAWRHLAVAADLELTAPAPAGSKLRGSWQLVPAALGDLVADLSTLAPPTESPVSDWLAQEPFRAGQLQLSGSLQLPWPLPAETPPEVLTAGLTVSGEIAGGRVALPDGRGEVELAAELEVAGNRLEVRRFSAAEPGGAIALSGVLSAPLPGAAGRLHGEVTGGADLARLMGFLPEPPALPGRDPGSTPPVQMSGRLSWLANADLADPPSLADVPAWQALLEDGKLTGIELSGELADLVLTGVTPGEPWRLEAAGFQSDLRTAIFNLDGLSHPAARGGATGKALQLLPEPELQFDLNVAFLDVDRLVQLFTPPEQTAWLDTGPQWPRHLLDGLVGLAYAAAPETAPAKPPGESIPADLKVKFTGRAEQVILQKARYDDIKWRGRLVNRRLFFGSVTGNRSGGQIRGQGDINYRSDPYGHLTFSAEATAVPAQALVQPYAPGIAPMLLGDLSATVNGNCSLKDKDAVLGSLTLDGDAAATDGSIDANSLLAGISSYLGDRQDLKLIRFREFGHHFEVRQGRYFLKNLCVSGLDTDWWGDGWLGFKGGIDLKLAVKLPAGFQPHLGDLSFLADTLRGEDGRIKLDLHLTGRAARPDVSLDLTAAKERAKRKVEDSLRKGVDGLLDKLRRK